MSIVPKIEASTLKKESVGTLLRIDLNEGPFLAFVVGDDKNGKGVVIISLQGPPRFQHGPITQDFDAWSFGKDWIFEITSLGDRFVDAQTAANTAGLLTVAPDGSPAVSVVDASLHNDVVYWDVRHGAPLPQRNYRPLTAASWRIWASAEERQSAVAMPLYDTDDFLETVVTEPEKV